MVDQNFIPNLQKGPNILIFILNNSDSGMRAHNPLIQRWFQERSTCSWARGHHSFPTHVLGSGGALGEAPTQCLDNTTASYKLRVLAYQLSRASISGQVGNIGLSDGFCFACQQLEIVQHIFWDSWFARCCWSWFEDLQLQLLQGRLHWQAALLSDGCAIICVAFYGLWHCLRIVVLFVLLELWCKLVFDYVPSS